jgi:hypothetical protein
MENPRSTVSEENTSQKSLSEVIVNDSDSDGGNFSELSERDTCKVHSLFSSSGISSSSKEQEVVHPEPDRGRKRTCRTLPKCSDTDFELGWKEKIQMVQKPAFSGVSGINKNIKITKTAA